jgi:hypothetical protein
VSATLVGLAALVAVATAIRSIWSPCGLSMLSTITPMAEAGRGHRFRSTAVWFVVGSVVGGLTLGGLMGGIALVVGDLGTTAMWIVAVASLVAAASDGRLGGFHLPGHDRQVNERWLDRYRSWVYGAGFGWQIGVGLATYIMTAGLYLLILMGALSNSLWAALTMGALFGLVRGLAVYLAAGLDSGDKLLAFHARFEQWREPVRQSMIVVLAVVAIVAAAGAGASFPILAAALAVAGTTIGLSVRGPHEAAYLSATSS